MQIEVRITGLDGLKEGFLALATAMSKSEMLGQTQNPQETKAAVTKRAKKNADEAPATASTTVETPAAPAKEKKAKPEEPDFATLDRDQKVEHLRQRMVQVSVKCGGNKDKTFSFLKKYGANKTAELSDENLDKVKNDIEVFLSGPDAIGV